jgi:DNA (cytosine-5)-methyltransferase 1
VALENVPGTLTSRGGADFAAIATALSEGGYRFGALVIDARLFVPQSRPRIFFIAIRGDERTPPILIDDGPQADLSPPALTRAVSALASAVRANWVWWRVPRPAVRNVTFADVIEEPPIGVRWHSAQETQRLLCLMAPANRAKVAGAQRANRPMIGCLYRRTRPDEHGVGRQRAEVRFDDVAGCLRTPAGGSSRQTILLVDGGTVRSRLLSPREAARLMGLDDSYKLPARYNDAYHLIGDGVCVPLVRHLAATVFEPILAARRSNRKAA